MTPTGGYNVIGVNPSSDVLELLDGGGPGYVESVVVGATPGVIVEPNNLGLNTPGVVMNATFDGQIAVSGPFNGAASPRTQLVRYAGLSSIIDSLQVKSMTVIGSPSSGALGLVSKGDLATGLIRPTLGGVPSTPIHFAQKGSVGVFGKGGVVLGTFPAVVPAAIPAPPATKTTNAAAVPAGPLASSPARPPVPLPSPKPLLPPPVASSTKPLLS
jgi:hypothetical protein